MAQSVRDKGAVYTCNFAYESVYDSVYDLLPKVSQWFIIFLYFLKCRDRPLYRVSAEELDPYLVYMQSDL
jgi:hypothetical protein